MKQQLDYSDFQSISYMGSKKRLMGFIHASFKAYKKEFVEFKLKSFLDVFCGSGSVAFYFRHQYQLITNDKLAFSQIIMGAYLKNKRPPKFYQIYIDDLNSLNIDDFESWQEQGKIDGWISQNYGGEYLSTNNSNVDINGRRKIWIMENAKKIEMMLSHIKTYPLKRVEKNVLRLALFLAIDKISNTIGHQNGYLKEWAAIALAPIHLKLPKVETWKRSKHKTLCSDVFKKTMPYADIAYIDPPYGTNNMALSTATRYASFYHLWDTLITSKPFHRPELFGKAGKPTANKGFTEAIESNHKEIVIPELIKLIKRTNSKFIALSYSNKGLLTLHEIEQIFQAADCDMDYLRLFTSTHKSNHQKHTAKKAGQYIQRKNEKAELIEYLFIVKKKNNAFSQSKNKNSDLSCATSPQHMLRGKHKKKRYISYYRTSIGEDEDAKINLKTQQDEMNHFINSKKATLVQEFTEIETNTPSQSMPMLYQAIEVCRLQNATLLIAKLDRLSRDISFLSILQQSDIRFIALDIPKANHKTLVLMLCLARQERENLSKKIKEGLISLKSKNKQLGGKRDKSYVFNEKDIEKANQVKKERYQIYKNKLLPIIIELKDNGFTYAQICQTLEERKIKTFRNKEVWSIHAVRSILK